MAGFRFGQELRQTARQEMRLQPRMLQSIEVLQLARGELETYLREALVDNEALGLDESVVSEAPTPMRAAGSPGPRGSREASDRFDAWLENQPDAGQGLVEHLDEQVAMLDLRPELRQWVRLVISCLDPSGYLSISDEALMEHGISQGLEGDAGLLGRAIAVVQRLEPRGVGGRDAVESLLLQLEPDEPDYELLCRLLEEMLEEVAKNKLPAVARELGVDLERLEELLARLRQLELAPCAGLSSEEHAPLRPEVIVEATDSHSNGFEIRIDRSGLPPLRVDPDVEDLARDREQPSDVRRYLRHKVERAHWLVDALEQRTRTLQRIATTIFLEQRAFLERGPSHLVPLRMTDLAEELSIHVSTVSRGVAGKYAQTPWGIFPLRSFFQAAAGGAATIVRGTLQEELRRIVDAEDAHDPLSDEDLVKSLAQQGFDVARRTVAKYRRELDIPSSYRRRKFMA